MGNKFRKLKLNDGKDKGLPADTGDQQGSGSQGPGKMTPNEAAGAAGGTGQVSEEIKIPEPQVKVTVEEVGASDGTNAENTAGEPDEVINKFLLTVT